MERIARKEISESSQLTASTSVPHEVTMLSQVNLFGTALAEFGRGISTTNGGGMLSLKAHNGIDYVAALFLLFMPALFRFSQIEVAYDLFRVLGISLLAYSLTTKYEFALWRKLPIGAHMTLDLAIGVILLLAPLVLGYRELLSAGQELAHYIMGVGLIAFVAITRSKTEAEKKAFESHETRLAS